MIYDIKYTAYVISYIEGIIYHMYLYFLEVLGVLRPPRPQFWAVFGSNDPFF